MTDPVRTCRRTWRRLGVPRESIREMSTDLEQDLAEAAADGVPAATILGGPPAELAEQWARERGLVRPLPRIATTAATAFAGAVPGVGLALFVAFGIGDSPTFNYIFGATTDPDGGRSIGLPDWAFVVGYAIGVAFAVLGALAAVAALLHTIRDPAVRRTVRALTVVLPASAAVALAVLLVLLNAADNSGSEKEDFALGALCSVLVLVLAVGAARWWAVRRERRDLTATR